MATGLPPPADLVLDGVQTLPLAQQEASAKKERGGRPKSKCWKFFDTEGKRDDKSKREDVKCRFCTMVLAGRAEAMEKHIAQDCRHAEPDAKAEMQQVLLTKQVNGKKAKRKAAEARLEEGAGANHPMEAAAAQMGVMPLLEVAQQQQAQHQQQQQAAAAQQQQQAAMGGGMLHAMAAPLDHHGGVAGAAAWLAPGAAGGPLGEMSPIESLSLVIKNQVEMRAMLNNIPIRLRNSKSCTREAVLRPLFRERFHMNEGVPGQLPPAGLFPLTWGDALRVDAYRLDALRNFYADDFGTSPADSLEEKQSKFLEWAGSVRP